MSSNHPIREPDPVASMISRAGLEPSEAEIEALRAAYESARATADRLAQDTPAEGLP